MNKEKLNGRDVWVITYVTLLVGIYVTELIAFTVPNNLWPVVLADSNLWSAALMGPILGAFAGSIFATFLIIALKGLEDIEI